jgi:hypothetical protein
MQKKKVRAGGQDKATGAGGLAPIKDNNATMQFPDR